MQKTICDTNIWYDISNGEIHQDEIDDKSLIGTSVNIIEISKTPNLISDTELVISAVKSMYSFNHAIMAHNPIEHLIAIFNPEYIPEWKVEERLLRGFSILMNINPKEIPPENLIDTEKQINLLDKADQELLDSVNVNLSSIKLKIKKIGKKNYRKVDFTESWKQYFSDLVLEYSLKYYQKEIKLDVNSKLWNDVEFFLYTWESYFKNNIEIGNWKLNKNDWGDLFNLIYVQPGFKYWTEEKKWKRIFKENNKLRKYTYL